MCSCFPNRYAAPNNPIHTKQINTKFFNGTIKRISYNTFSKMLTYNMLGNMIGAGVSGVMDAIGANEWMANWFHQRTGF